MALWFRGRFAVLVFDLYPDALRANGFREEGLISLLWGRRNQKVFLNAHRIYTLSDAMKTGISRYGADMNVRVIPNWSAFSHLIQFQKKTITYSGGMACRGSSLFSIPGI
jgi:hypothetical protein